MTPPKRPASPAAQPPHARLVPLRAGAGSAAAQSQGTPLPLPLSTDASLPGAGFPQGNGKTRSGRWEALAWCCSAALLAAGLAWVGVALLGPKAAWVAPLAAAVGALAAALPMAAIATRRPAPADAVQPPVVQVAMAPMGVPRVLFSELAAREWARARRYGSGAALLVVNVDRAARLNQARGPRATDAVLAALLRETAPMLRSADLLTRYSESEMAVFLAPADATGALDVAERIRERIEQLEVPLPAHPAQQTAASAANEPVAQALRVTVSIGVAHLRPAHLDLQALLDDAENAAVAARHAGGNCVRAAPLGLNHPSAAGDERDGQWTEPKA